MIGAWSRSERSERPKRVKWGSADIQEEEEAMEKKHERRDGLKVLHFQ